MKLEGFIGSAYTLDSVNVDAQACVNLYPETIESGRGKSGQVAYLRSTPGLDGIAEVGEGPIRCVHVDSIGRIFVVSGNRIYSLSKKYLWRYQFTVTVPGAKTFTAASDVNPPTDIIDIAAHGYATGLRVRLTTSSQLPPPLVAGTDYYVIRVDADTIKLAESLADAEASTAIDITGTGLGTNTMTPQSYSNQYNIKHSEIDFDLNSFRKASHGWINGLAVQFKASATYATGVVPDTTYYVTNATEDTFQLASSFANALTGTSIDLTDTSDAWTAKALGALGEYGGSPVGLAGSSGKVKAASMSLGGAGTDSSTVFVDGSNNYLLEDDEGNQSLGYLGASFIARAVFDIVDDITVESAGDVDQMVGREITISDSETSAIPADSIVINWNKFTVDATGVVYYELDVFRYPGQTLTTAELIQALQTNGVVSGKTIVINDYDHDPAPAGVTRDTSFNYNNQFTYSGGGTELTSAAFGTPILEEIVRITISGEGYGSVPTATQIVWSDGYFIVNKANTNQFYVSDLQGFNIDALSFASSEGSPDVVVALAVLNRTLYVFNELTTEVYANTGNADFPFERMQGGFIEVGALSGASVAQGADTLFWLGRSKEGQGIVYAMSGSSPRRISTHPIEQAISGYASPQTATGYCYAKNGHVFYALNFAEATWVYDLATGMWHQRAYTSAGDLERHRVECVAYVPQTGVLLGGDYETGDIYVIDDAVYSDDGDAITRLRASPHLSTSGLNYAFYSRFQLDMETGIGLDGGVQGSSPTVMLDWSDDGGHTWASEQWALADAGSGTIGDYKKRVIWRRLGKSRDRIWRVKITDPVKVVLIDAHVDVQAGAS